MGKSGNLLLTRNICTCTGNVASVGIVM